MAFLITPGFPWVAVQWGIWQAGGIAVPLPLNSTKPELVPITSLKRCAFYFEYNSMIRCSFIVCGRSARACIWPALEMVLSPPIFPERLLS